MKNIGTQETNGLLFDQVTGMQALDSVLQLTQEWLQDFAASPEFVEKMQLAFGDGVNVASLQETWASGNLGTLPEIEVRSASEINGANGAFAAETNTIYLAQELLSEPVEQVAWVFLEEYGHYVDSVLNSGDVPGDEGAIFAEVVRGNELSSSDVAQLKAEDDTATVLLDGEAVAIEQAIDTVSGDMREVEPPDALSNLQDPNTILVFPEQQGVILSEIGIDKLDITEIGTYDNFPGFLDDNIGFEPQPISDLVEDPTQTKVNSYFLQFFPDFGGNAEGIVRFDEEILGILALSSSQNETNETLGASQTNYDVGGAPDDNTSDVVEFVDKNTVRFQSEVTTARDQLRIITLDTTDDTTNTTTINFEEGFTDQQEITAPVTVPGNQVTFSVGSNPTEPENSAFIAEVGDPVTGFQPDDGRGTNIESEIGSFFLADEMGGNDLSERDNYFIQFDQPVSTLSVDLLDFRADGGGKVGDTITLTAFSDSAFSDSTVVGSDSFTITSDLPDPNLETLSITNPNGLIRSASIINGGDDNGTGIDNITFSTVAGPGITITQTDGSTDVTEGGTTDTYEVVLDKAPTADVEIDLSLSTTEITLDAGGDGDNQLIFTPDNWDTPQTVTVSAINDSDVEGDQAVTISHSVDSSDTNYDEPSSPRVLRGCFTIRKLFSTVY